MRLFYLNLENFQGIKAWALDFKGLCAEIRADNGLGKTTIGNAIVWLLVDKPLTGAKNFSPKTRDAAGNDIHNLDTSVEGTWKLDNGQIIALKKVLSEDWRKTRGSNTETLKGNTISYYIDGVPVKELEYVMRLLNICDPEHMKMLMMPGEFAETLVWQGRRRLLLDICGDITDDDVINSTPDLKQLPEFLQKPGTSGQFYTVDEYNKIASAKMRDVNDELESIPARIDEANKAMPEITKDDKAILTVEFGSLQTSKYLKENEKHKLQDGSSINDIVRDELAAAESELSRARVKYMKDADKANEVVQSEISQLRYKYSDLKSNQLDFSEKSESATRKVKHLKELREMLLKSYSNIQKRYNDISAEQWDGEEICPRCKQSLPPEQIAHAQEEFNQHKSERLEAARGDMERINKRGNTECSKQMVADEEAAVKKYNDEAAKIQEDITALEVEIKDKEKSILLPDPFEDTKEYTRISGKIADFRDSDGKSNEVVTGKVNTIQAEIDAIDAQISAYMEATKHRDTAETQEKRISELSAREKELAKQYDKLKQGVYLCETFIRTKVSLLDDKINSRFTSVRFKLFDDQMNGGLKEMCEVMVPCESGLVPYKDANNAARINAGLEIIGILSEHWGVSMPVIVDNAESVTRLGQIDTQVIRLVVDENYKQLTLNPPKNKVVAA